MCLHKMFRPGFVCLLTRVRATFVSTQTILWSCIFECMKQSFVWIKTVMPALRHLQTFATIPYITATTGERKTWQRSSAHSNGAVMLTLIQGICLRFAKISGLRNVREKTIDSIKAYIYTTPKSNVTRYYN